MKHGRIPIESISERKFRKVRAAIERAPIWKCRNAFPLILNCQCSDIHPVARRHSTIFSALLVNFWVKVITRA